MQKVKEQRIKEGQDYDTIIQKSRPDPIYSIYSILDIGKKADSTWGFL